MKQLLYRWRVWRAKRRARGDLGQFYSEIAFLVAYGLLPKEALTDEVVSAAGN